MTERPLPWLPIAIGVVVGAVLAFGNCLIGLKTGLWDTAQLTSTLLTFLLCAPLCRLVGKAFDIHDNNLAQTTSAAVAAMPATMGLLAAVPALGLLGKPPSTATLVVSAASFGMLGIASALLLAPRLIDRDKLPFPTGVATAELIRAMHADRKHVRERAMYFGIAFAVAVLFTLLRDLGEVIPGNFETTVVIAAIPVTIGVAASPLLLGSGALIGARISLSLAGGALLAWLGGVWLAGSHQWADGESIGAWLRWPGVGMLLGGSLPSLVSVVRQLRSSTQALGDAGPALKIVGVTGVVAVVVTHFGFDVPWVFALIAVVLAVVLSTVAGRAAGTTDVAPLGEVGELALFVGASAGTPTIGVATAGVSASIGAQNTQLLWALKAGRALGTPVRSQWLAQAVGVIAGAPICIAIWIAVTRAWAIGSKDLPAPYAAQWKSVAEVLHHGWSALPAGAGVAALVGVGVGDVLSRLERVERLAPWVPAPLGIGLGFLLPVSSCLAIGVGGVAGSIGMRQRNGEVLVSSIASGMLAGEAIPVVALVLWQLM
ncbi:MAG TPA: OPT/YSL family transporter [Kofleriaceae bacterium]|nr:OPT/YSL family transporter [Kofleriaceae bacterium]